MKLTKNLKDVESYKQKIRGYLSQAFKKLPPDSEMLPILEHELMEMYQGDVPYFQASSSSRDLVTKAGEIKDFFELTAVENIKRKINKLSEDDLKHQKDLIATSYQARPQEALVPAWENQYLTHRVAEYGGDPRNLVF